MNTNMHLHLVRVCVCVCVYCLRGFGVARVDEAMCASATALEAKQQPSKLCACVPRGREARTNVTEISIAGKNIAAKNSIVGTPVNRVGPKSNANKTFLAFQKKLTPYKPNDMGT